MSQAAYPRGGYDARQHTGEPQQIKDRDDRKKNNEHPKQKKREVAYGVELAFAGRNRAVRV